MDPNPIRHPAVLLAYVRDEIEPTLISNGFSFAGRNNSHGFLANLWIDYRRGETTVSIRFDPGRLAAEFLSPPGEVETIADVDLDGVQSHSQLMERAGRFVDTVLQAVPAMVS